ncbi:uncharacterized protein [Argopecten irradians]|uniref:uncharacterized protein n=1 Tax=Argopecten irradians TaxID=31199 RepID=UPI00371F00DA
MLNMNMLLKQRVNFLIDNVFYKLVFLLQIDHAFLNCPAFVIGDVWVDNQRHILFATAQQLDLLRQARRWYLDGTFKVGQLLLTSVIILFIPEKSRSKYLYQKYSGWHHRLNGKAGRANLPFYMLVPLLLKEATLVTIQQRLVSENALQRHQRVAFRRIQGRVHTMWDQYDHDELTTSQFLKKIGDVYAPRPVVLE